MHFLTRPMHTAEPLQLNITGNISYIYVACMEAKIILAMRGSHA